MKKRKNIILSAITCFVSICLLMLGVYAATSPSVSVSGQVSYTARDVSVLVQAKTSNDGSNIAYSKTAPANKTALLALSKTTDKINQAASGDTPAEYFDWTQGEQSGNNNTENETLSTWDIGTVPFKESSTGIGKIKVKFSFKNYSNYPVMMTLTFRPYAEMTEANVIRDSEEKYDIITKYLDVAGTAGASASTVVTYSVKDDSKGVTATGLLRMNIRFEKTAPKEPPANDVRAINANNGLVTLGTTTNEGDLQWKCFAYSFDGYDWQPCTGTIPSSAQFGYFILDTYSSDFEYKYLEYFSGEGYKGYYTEVDGNVIDSIFANDYFYSDIRQTLKDLQNIFSIDTNSEIYQAIQERSIEDLYSNINYDGNELELPTAADGGESDMFWLLSYSEATSLLSQILWGDSSSMQSQNLIDGELISTYAGEIARNFPYWLRSPINPADVDGENEDDASAGVYCCAGEQIVPRVADANGSEYPIYMRPAFMLQFA